MDDLSFILDEDLQRRNKELIQEYKKQILVFKLKLSEISNLYNELLLIQEELKKRGKLIKEIVEENND